MEEELSSLALRILDLKEKAEACSFDELPEFNNELTEVSDALLDIRDLMVEYVRYGK